MLLFRTKRLLSWIRSGGYWSIGARYRIEEPGFIPATASSIIGWRATPEQALDFYNFRDTNPEKIGPHAADGAVQKFNDIPLQYSANVDVSDPPFDRHPGETPAMTAQDEADIIVFLKTLNDGYSTNCQICPPIALSVAGGEANCGRLK